MSNNDVLLLPAISFCRSAHQDLESTSWTLHVLFLHLGQLGLDEVLLVALGEVPQGGRPPTEGDRDKALPEWTRIGIKRVYA